MKKNVSKQRQFLINRLGFIRNKANLSARELSLRLGFSSVYISKFENGDFNIPSEVLLNAIEICNSTPDEFFAYDISNYEETKEVLELYSLLSLENKKTILDLIKKLK